MTENGIQHVNRGSRVEWGEVESETQKASKAIPTQSLQLGPDGRSSVLVPIVGRGGGAGEAF